MAAPPNLTPSLRKSSHQLSQSPPEGRHLQPQESVTPVGVTIGTHPHPNSIAARLVVGNARSLTVGTIPSASAFRQQEGRAQLSETLAHLRDTEDGSPHRTPSPSRTRRHGNEPHLFLPAETTSSPPSIEDPLLESRDYAAPAIDKGKRQKKPVSSFQIFCESASIYLACLILPSVVGSLYKQWLIHLEKSSLSPGATAAGLAADESSPSYYYVWAHTYYDSYLKPYACSVDPTEYSPTLGSYYAYYLGCQNPDNATAAIQSMYLFSPDTTPSQDLQFVLLLSICMALIRSVVVAYTVMHRFDFASASYPSWYSSSASRVHASPSSSIPETTVQAMIRCKSIGLLSPDYYYGGNSLTPTNSVRLFLEERLHPAEGGDGAVDGDAAGDARRSHMEDRDDSNSHLGLGIDDSSNHLDSFEENEARENWWNSTRATSAQAAGDEPVVGAESMDRATVPSSSIPPLESDAMKEAGAGGDGDDVLASLYAAPRFATAIFRLGYSVSASMLAYVWFHRASFWPWYVGGTGTTEACWDLNGGLTVGMDSDFDSRNLVLKRYFLLQASYHSQSIAFHILSLVMLIWDYRQQQIRSEADHHRKRDFWSVAQKTTRSYARSLLQHLLALLLIAVAYIFSSLRRLGAIGMFALDVSSSFMHLLQIALNRSSTSSASHPRRAIMRWIPWLYYGGVLPSFVGMRLCVWPRLWYSATFESHSWFEQLERTLFPNSALVVKTTLHVWMVLVMYLTAVNLKRLYRHPHLHRKLRR
jgi:TLC domain